MITYKRLGLIAAGFVAAFGLLEAGLHLFGVTFEASFFVGDPVRGWALRPGAHGWNTEERLNYVRINRAGFRDRDHSLARPPGTFRIAVLGDSFTEASQVRDGDVYTSLLEKMLGKCERLRGRKIEVMNFGVAGYGTAQELLTLRSIVLQYDPDLVLLAFYTGNDVLNNHRALNPSAPESTPYFVFQGDRLVLDDSFKDSYRFSRQYLYWRGLVSDLMNRSRLLSLLNESLFLLKLRQPGDVQGGHDGLWADYQKVVPYLPPDHPQAPSALAEAWRVTEALVLEMRREVQSHGAEFWLVVTTMPRQVQPDIEAREAFRKQIGVETLDYPDHRLNALAEKADIPSILLVEALGRYAQTHHVALHGFPPDGQGGHWNEQGHRVAAETISQELCTRARLSSTTSFEQQHPASR